MKTVKLVNALPGHRAGQLLTVDENSAAALIRRGDAEEVDDAVSQRQRVDLSGQPVAGPVEDTQLSAEDVAVSRDSLKSDLLAAAVAAGVEGAAALTKNELADALGLE
jgi:hypothetical protein